MPLHPGYLPANDRFDAMKYRRAGRSGLMLPELSLGLWQNFGDLNPFQTQRDIARRALDLGIIHYDLANNYGPPAGAAEENFGRIFAKDLAPYRDDLIISTKAGYSMQDGPYGDHGSRKYLLASLDASLARMGLDYVDVFYHHRPDPDTPLEETMGALAAAVHSGKALYAGVSNYSAERTRQAAEILADLGVPLALHQPSYNMFNRHIEDAHNDDGYDGVQHESVLDVVGDLGIGTIVFSPLAQGLLTNRYLNGIAPAGSRASRPDSLWLNQSNITEEYLATARALNEIAASRGQTLAQLAISWDLRDPRIT
ncbi:MAG: aldo/keto reductase, partial [Cellulomonadaceae bacterium]|nr:aldo/keto reductase [Cellulomonadaceae bacterium]